VRILGEPVGHHATGRAGTDYDVIVINQAVPPSLFCVRAHVISARPAGIALKQAASHYNLAVRDTGGGNQPCTLSDRLSSRRRTVDPPASGGIKGQLLCAAALNSLWRSGRLSISSRPLAVLTLPSGDAGSAVALAAFRSNEGGSRSRLERVPTSGTADAGRSAAMAVRVGHRGQP